MSPASILLILLLAAAPAAASSAAAAAGLVLAPGEPLTRETVAGIIRDLLPPTDGQGTMVVEVQAPALPLPNRAGTPTRVTVTDLSFEPRTGRYQALLLAALDSGETAMIKSFGLVRQMVPVALL